MQVACPHCGQILTVRPQLVGKQVGCAKCKGSFIVPAETDEPPVSNAAPSFVPAPSGPPPGYGAAGPAPAGAGFGGGGGSVNIEPAPAPRGRSSGANAGRRWREPNSWLDLFDLSFQTYLTPWIVRISWVIVLILAALRLVYLIILSIEVVTPEAAVPRLPFPGENIRVETRFQPPQVKIPLEVWRGIELAFYGVLTLLGLLWARVGLEGVIVIFNIAEDVRSIDKRLAERA